jgi:hypothetical protein
MDMGIDEEYESEKTARQQFDHWVLTRDNDRDQPPELVRYINTEFGSRIDYSYVKLHPQQFSEGLVQRAFKEPLHEYVKEILDRMSGFSVKND